MRIDRIQVVNFRRLAAVDLELPDGVTALVGRNGAGKSTLLEALGWCLYGHEAARTGKDLIKRRDALPSDDVRVVLAFRYGAHAYEVTRELLGKAGAHVATVTVDGVVVVPPGAQSQREATQYVSRLFHMDRDAFFTSLVARQRELASLSEATPSKRKAILLGLLRIDAVDAAILEARTSRRDTRKQLEGLRSALLDPKPMRESLAALRASTGKLEAAVHEADTRVAALTDEAEELRARRLQSRARATEYARLEGARKHGETRLAECLRARGEREAEMRRIVEAAAQADAFTPRLAKLPQLRQDVERHAAARIRMEESTRTRAGIREAEADHARALEQASEAKRLLDAIGPIQRLAQRLAPERARLEARLTLAQQAAANASAEQAESRRALQQLQEKLARIRQMGPESPCPTCTRPLREHHDELVHDFESESKTLVLRAETAGTRLAQAQEEERKEREALRMLAEREAELRSKLDQAARAEVRLDAAKASAVEAQARRDKLEAHAKAVGQDAFDPDAEAAARRELAELQTLEGRAQRLRAEAERGESVRAILTELGKREQSIHAESRTTLDALKALAFDAVAHEGIERAADAVEHRLSEARVVREKLRGDLVRAGDEEKRLLHELERQEALSGRAGALEVEARLLERLAGDRDAGLLPEFKDHLIGRVRPLLTMHAGSLFRDMTDGRYADLEVGEDYDLLVHEDGQAYGLARFSGGESDLANLCLRLAVSQVVSERAGSEGFGFLALDEIFGSQDEVRKGNILRQLGALSRRFRQILLITHIEDVKEAAEHVLRVEALDDGTSRVTLEG